MSEVDFTLAGKVALVTGASRGIGASIARAFAERGATVVISSRKQPDLDAVATAINALEGGRCIAIACHGGKLDQMQQLFAAITEQCGQLDILVNNAATNPYFGPAIDCPEAAFDKTLEVNLKGYFFMSQMAGRLMRKVIVGSFHERSLKRFRELCPEVATSAGPVSVRLLLAPNWLGLSDLLSPSYPVLQIPPQHSGLTLATPRLIRNAQTRGLHVQLWTINEQPEMRRLLEMGANGLITDYPDRALQLLGRSTQLGALQPQ